MVDTMSTVGWSLWDADAECDGKAVVSGGPSEAPFKAGNTFTAWGLANGLPVLSPKLFLSKIGFVFAPDSSIPI